MQNSQPIRYYRWGALLLLVVGGVLFIAVKRGAIPNPISRLPSILKPGPELPAPQPTPPPASSAGLKIIAPKGGGIYLGAYNQQGTGVDEFEKAIGKKIAIFPAAYICKDGGTEGTLPKIDIPCHESLWQKGYVSTYAVEVLPSGQFSNEDIVAGKIDNELKQVARDIANWGRPIFWFYQREPSGQFPCKSCTQDGDKPKLYIAVHRHIHDIIENEIKSVGKQSTVTWVMGGIIEAGSPGFYTAYYPGDAYVDWHAFDAYVAAACPYKSISTLPGWKEALQINPNKPILYMEFGVVTKGTDDGVTGCEALTSDRSAWFQAFFNDLHTNPAMKNLAAFLYWQEPFSNTRIVSGDAAAKTWQQEIQANPNFWHSQVQTSVAVAPSPPPPPSSKIISSGTYSCSTCQKSHQWQINDKHLMYWDGQPYIPVAEFWTNRQYASSQITDFNIWIDGDFSSLGLTEAQYFSQLDQDTTSLTNQGKTFILVVSYPIQPKDASWLFDPTQVSQMTTKWRQYAPYVRKEGLRGIALFGELNWDWTWPAGRTADDYGKAMGNLAKEAQQIFGEVPVFYKTSGAGGGFNNVLAGGTYANGFGFDLYPLTCSSTGFDQASQTSLNTLKNTVSASPRPLGLLWMAEFGKNSGIPENQIKNYNDAYTAFSTKSELQCNLDYYINAGLTGFIHGIAGNAAPSAKTQEVQWYGELKSYVQQQVLQKASGGLPPGTVSPPETPSAVTPPPAPETSNQYNVCYAACLKEGNGASGCANFCAKNSGQETPARE